MMSWVKENVLGLSLVGLCLGAAWWVGDKEEMRAETFEAETRHCVKCDKVTGVLDEHEVCDLYSIFDYDDFLTMSSFKRGGLYGMICEECKLPHSGSSYCSICNRSQPIEMRGGKPACTSCGYLLTEWRAHRDKERAQRGAESFEANEDKIVAFRYTDKSPAHICRDYGYTNNTRCGQPVNWDRVHYPYHPSLNFVFQKQNISYLDIFQFH